MVVGDSVAGTLGLGFEHVRPGQRPRGVEPRPRSAAGCSTTARCSRAGSSSRSTPACNWRGPWPADLAAVQARRRGDAGGRVGHPRPQVDGQRGEVRHRRVRHRTFLHQLDDATTLPGVHRGQGRACSPPRSSQRHRAGGRRPGARGPEYDPWRVDRINSLYRDFQVDHPGRYHAPRPQPVRVAPGQVHRRAQRSGRSAATASTSSPQGSTMVVNWLDAPDQADRRRRAIPIPTRTPTGPTPGASGPSRPPGGGSAARVAGRPRTAPGWWG